MNAILFFILNLINFSIWFYFSFRLDTLNFQIFSVVIIFSLIIQYINFLRKSNYTLLFRTDIFYSFVFNNVLLTFIFFIMTPGLEVSYKLLSFVVFLIVFGTGFILIKRDMDEINGLRRLLDVKIQEIKELHNISNVINGVLDIEKLLDMVLSVTVDVLKVGRVSLFLYDMEKKNLVLKISKGIEKRLFNTLKIKDGEGIIGRVAHTGEALLIKDIEKDMPELSGKKIEKNNENSKNYKNKSFLCVPLKIKNEVIGVISLNDKENNEPFNENDLELLNILSSQIAVAIENANLYDSMKDNYKSTIMALSNALDAKDSYTGGHSSQVTKYAIPIAEEMGFEKDFIDSLEYAGLLHDIGKIGIIENILNKKGRLTDDEFSIIKKHPVIGAEILASVEFLDDVVPIVRYHHERWDGNGYPEGIKGENIPIGARIIAVADTFDAMTSDRPYRQGLPAEVARDEIQRCSGSQFDPECVEAFLRAFDSGKIVVEKYETLDSVNRWL